MRVIDAKEDTSKGGNDMFKLTLRVIHDNGREGPALFDYLVFSESSFWKVDIFLKAVGQNYEEGSSIELHADEMIGLQARARLGVSEFNGKRSNKVEAYLVEESF